MRLDTHTHKHNRENTMYETSSALRFGDCIPQHLAEKNKLLHLLLADWNTLTHTHVHTKNITPPPAVLLWLQQNINCSIRLISTVTRLLKSSVILNKALVPVAKQELECTVTYAADNIQCQKWNALLKAHPSTPRWKQTRCPSSIPSLAAYMNFWNALGHSKNSV